MSQMSSKRTRSGAEREISVIIKCELRNGNCKLQDVINDLANSASNQSGKIVEV